MQMIVSYDISLAGQSISSQNTYTGDGAVLADVAVPADAEGYQVDISFKASDLTDGALFFSAEGGPLTIKTNNSGSPDDTFTVPANGTVQVTALTENILGVYVDNGDAANITTLHVRGVKDVSLDD